MNKLVLVGVVAILFVGLGWAAKRQIASLQVKDATDYVTGVAASIQDRPECRGFKDGIMGHASGSPYDGKTVGPVVALQQKARAAGCVR